MNMKRSITYHSVYRRGTSVIALFLSIVMALSVALPASTAFAAEGDGTVTLTKLCYDDNGRTYRVTVEYLPDETGIPADAELTASPLSAEGETYAEYFDMAVEALRFIPGAEESATFFDISINDESGAELQPAEGSSVDVRVRLASAPKNDVSVVHFGSDTEILSSNVSGKTVSFETTGFSVYALIDLPDLAYEDPYMYDSTAFDQQPLYLSATTSNGNTYYITSGITHDNAAKSDVINRTAQNKTDGAVPYYFEKVPGGADNQYYMYYLENGTKQYVKLTGKTGAAYTASPDTVFNVEPIQKTGVDHKYGIYFVQSNKIYYLNLRKDESGKGFSGSDYGPRCASDSVGSYILVEKFLPSNLNVSGLDGKSYGLVMLGKFNTAFAVSVDAQDDDKLDTIAVAPRANPLDDAGKVVVRVGEDLPMFTFHNAGNDTYYVTANVGGSTKYLRVTKASASFVDVPDEYCRLTVLLGTGETGGMCTISSEAANGGYLSGVSVNSSSGTNGGISGFTGKGSNVANKYFYLAEKIHLENDDLVPYTAVKVNISDFSKVKNGTKLVIYTRVWDEAEKEYVYYGINHDGSLLRLYDEGETVRWAGTQINTMLWELTEYYYTSLFWWMPKTRNHYYDLRNTYSNKYIAPQYHTGQILQNRPVGVNLNGRRYGQHYSTILAWDDYRYNYAGLSVSADRSSVISVPMSQAMDFYFAVMQPENGDLTTADTIDNDEYGISLKMVEFPRERETTGARNNAQTEVIGSSGYTDLKFPTLNLMSKDLDDEDYPTALATGKSMKELFGTATPVNHLFLSEVYNESGYFQYDSTQNYATLLDPTGGISDSFTVYNELGTIETDTPSQGHSQFMPYNDLDTSLVSSYVNVKDVFNESLPLDDPRLGETLYSIPKSEANYHFGMEMTASFVQSKDGLDAWGHDIIFEFAGDDDMWLYVDGELVLDLGGIHSALVGKINYRTGEVQIPSASVAVGNHAQPVYTTLRAIFENNYREKKPNATEEEVLDYLDGIFKPGTSVFKDYTAHTMKMFYMERGAGASNLIMRFNLTIATDGQLLLSKNVSGTDKEDYTSAEFAYQLYYYDETYEDYRLVTREETEDGKLEYTGVSFVNYQNKNEPVKYAAEYFGYQSVFFLVPGEVAEIQFPSDDIHYYVKECRVNNSIYDSVSVNDRELISTQNGDYYDYAIPDEVIGERKVVKYDNHVSPNALRTLSITKNLYDVNNRQVHYPDDDTGFRFRVYIGEALDYYRMDSYYVKNPDGFYCEYDYQNQKFASVGKNVFDSLTADEKERCTFTTSPSGAVDKIPTDFTVEIRDLLIDTKFKIVEQESDIPKGYDLIGYERSDGSYIIEEGDTINSGVIRDRQDPHIIVNNHRGWGLTVEKVWSDSDFMCSHDDIYFAIYNKEPSAQNNEPIEGTVRRMKTSVVNTADTAETSLYYYFKTLVDGAAFSDYIVKEVALTDPVVDENGYVTSYSSISPLGGADALVNGGLPVWAELPEAVAGATMTDATPSNEVEGYGTFSYKVTYDIGTPTGPASNVRTDEVTNSRPGVRLVKVDADGDPLADAVFTLKSNKDGDDYSDVSKEEYVSDASGLITIAYPEEGVTYRLTEIETPTGYIAKSNLLSFSVTNGELTVTCGDSDSVTVSQPDDSGMINVLLKNYQTKLSAVKVDEYDSEPMSGVHFALYRQVISSSGRPRKDYYPLTGYDDLVTDSDGVIPGIDETLPKGTYYLTELLTPSGYYPLDDDICFSINDDGQITLCSDSDDAQLSGPVLNGQNELVYSLQIANRRTLKSITLDPQTLIADFGLDIRYNAKTNNHRVPSDSVYTYIGICDPASADDYGTEEAPELLAAAGVPYVGKYGTLTLSANGDTHYKINTMSFAGEDEFCLVAHVTQIENTPADVYVFETHTYLPATTIYYEDDFATDAMHYYNGTEGKASGQSFGVWRTASVTGANQQTEQDADLAANDAANIFGFDSHYTNFATYSNNSAHMVSVGNVNSPTVGTGGTWPYMTFDFAGTGFDLVSVTGNTTGMFTVKVYPLTTDANGVLTQGRTAAVSKVVDTYYGYDYGTMYVDANGAATLTQTNKPLYMATDEIIEAAEPNQLLLAGGKYYTPVKTYYDTNKNVTQTPYYYDANGRITEETYYVNKSDRSDVVKELPVDDASSYEPNYAYAIAEGFLVNPSASGALYQIPVIKVRNLTYGTYRAVIEPRYAARYSHNNPGDEFDYYDLYVDAFRIYDPAGVDDEGLVASTVIQKAYNYSDEAFEKFTTLKSVIIGVETMGSYSEDDVTKEGAVLVDGNKLLTSDRIGDYEKFGPNNEVYLSKGNSVAFEISATVVPADVQLQMKKISAAIPTLKVIYINSKGNVFFNDIEVRSASDLSYSIFDMIGKGNITWSSQRGGNQNSGLLIVTNDGEDESLVSITNLKWTFKNYGGNYQFFYDTAKNSTVSISSETVRSLPKALSFSRKNMVLTTEETEPAIYEDGVIKMSVVTDKSVESLVVRDQKGNLIDESILNVIFADVGDGLRQWTVTVAENEDDDYTFLIYSESDGLEIGSPIQINISVDNVPPSETPEEEPDAPAEPAAEEPAEEQPSDLAKFVEQLRELWVKLTDLIKKLLSFFGVEMK